MHFQILKGSDGQYYWRLRAANNETVAAGAEGYVSKRNVMRAVRRLVEQMLNLQDIPIIERLR